MAFQMTDRDIALDVVVRTEKDRAFLSRVLDAELRYKTPKNSGFITELVYGVFRHKLRIEWILNHFLRKPIDKLPLVIRCVLMCAVYELVFMSTPEYAVVSEWVKIAKQRLQGMTGLVNAVLRSVDESKVRYPEGEEFLSVFHSHPLWMIRIFGKMVDDVSALLRANNTPARTTVRVNTLRISLEDWVSLAGDRVSPAKWAEGCFYVNCGAPLDLPGYDDGWFVVQDESAILVGRLCAPAPGMRVLDMCSAPGGKTSHLAQMMENTGEIVAVEVNPRKAEALRKRLEILGVSIAKVVQGDSREFYDEEGFDIVLVDAPCSGLGVLRRHPELKWRITERDIRELVQCQRELLCQASKNVKPGGVLVYSTCTLVYEEDIGQVEDFLRMCPEFKIEGSKLVGGNFFTPEGYFLALPSRHGTDGMFAVRMIKQKTREE